VRLRRSLTFLGLLALLLVPSAQGKTFPTRWHEHFRYQGKLLMTFNTRAITINGQSWAVGGSFKNRTAQPIAIVVQAPGIAVATTPPSKSQKIRFIQARSVEPAFPKVLAPGQVWRGTFRGRGIPSWASYLMAVYGDFAKIAPNTPQGWRWITDHALVR
jgi:hypothetical protein